MMSTLLKLGLSGYDVKPRFGAFQCEYLLQIPTSARPEVRGTADVGWRSLFHVPLNPPRTHSRLYHHMCLRTDRQ